MKLFYKPGACSLSPHIALREAGMDFTMEKVDLATKKTEHGADYLDKAPDRQLLAPSGSMTRYHTLEWLNYIATELHKGFTPLFRPDTPDEFKPIARAALEKKFQYIEDELTEKQWLLGLRFTVADAYLFTVLRWAYAVKLDMNRFTHIADYMERMKVRPAVAAALAAEGIE